MSTGTEKAYIPVTTTTGQHAQLGSPAHATTFQASRSGAREQKEAVGEAAEKVIETGKQIFHQACDACHNWRHYPKLLTTALLLTAFLFGACSMGLVGKMRGSSGNYVAAHWDRNTVDAHHALDVILDHLQHPELYETTQKGVGVIGGARETIGNFLRGIMPGRAKARGEYERESGSWLGGPSGRMMGGREGSWVGGGESSLGQVGRQIYQKAGEAKDDLSYRMGDVGEKAKDVGYGIGHKISDLASSFKDSLVGHSEDQGYYEQAKQKAKRGMQQMGGGERGGYGGGGYSDDEEFRLAQQKLDRIARQAGHEL